MVIEGISVIHINKGFLEDPVHWRSEQDERIPYHQ